LHSAHIPCRHTSLLPYLATQIPAAKHPSLLASTDTKPHFARSTLLQEQTLLTHCLTWLKAHKNCKQDIRLPLFGKQAGYVQLQQHVKSKELLKIPLPACRAIEMSLLGASDERIQKTVVERGINTV
jgi:hypothetical protein